ncbi:MAG: D-glycero-beta-D-manno-heptose-7-phosphate kinase, partial [Saprospiraceae bacterium]|nr:D-glycero-beta-D-manno-heptose-7-phosphate kinase [Saprospiraceae bacterium]
MRKIRNYNILIIGDLMLDQYIKGKHLRQSPEADIPIILKASEENRLGGAGNVAINIKSLTANPILVSVTGNDAQSYKLKSILDKHQIKHQLIIDDSRPTTTKCRVIN